MTSPVHVDGVGRAGLQGRDVLAALTAFFGVVFAVNGYFLYAALSTHTGVVAVEPYRKGLAYNDRIAADERQSQLGWNAAVEVDRNGRTLLALTDRNGVPVSGVAVVGTVGRPVTGASDRRMALSESEPGRYVADIDNLAPGAWIISLEVSDRQGGAAPTYRLRRRIWLKP